MSNPPLSSGDLSLTTQKQVGYAVNATKEMLFGWTSGFISGLDFPVRYGLGIYRLYFGDPEGNKSIGSLIRAMRKGSVDPARVRNLWAELPEPMQMELVRHGGNSIGLFCSGLVVTRVLMYCISHTAGQIASKNLSPNMLRLLAPRARLFSIAAEVVLQTISLQGTFALFLLQQQKIFETYPGTELAYRRFITLVNDGGDMPSVPVNLPRLKD